MSIGIVIAMIVGGLASIVGIVQARKGIAWGKPVAIVGAILALGLSVTHLVQPDRQELRALQSERFAFVAGEQLGTYLAEQHGAARATVFTRPELENVLYTSVETASMDGLRTGLKTGFDAVEHFVLPGHQEPPSATTGSPEYLTMDSTDWVDWDQVREMLKTPSTSHDVMIFTVPPPHAFFQSLSAEVDAMPAVGLLFGDPDLVFSLIEINSVHAAVLMSPEPGKMPDLQDPLLDSRAAFDRLYILVTSENLAETRANFPDMDGRP